MDGEAYEKEAAVKRVWNTTNYKIEQENTRTDWFRLVFLYLDYELGISIAWWSTRAQPEPTNENCLGI